MTEVTLISLFTRTRFLLVPLARELLLFLSRQRLRGPGLGSSLGFGARLGLCTGLRLSLGSSGHCGVPGPIRGVRGLLFGTSLLNPFLIVIPITGITMLTGTMIPHVEADL